MMFLLSPIQSGNLTIFRFLGARIKKARLCFYLVQMLSTYRIQSK